MPDKSLALTRRSLAMLGAGGGALLLAGRQPAQAAAERTLNIGAGGSVTSLDPHFYNATPNNTLAMHLFDRLVERDAKAQLYPGLAESWRAISDTEWEFKLRPGVKWHDGKDFTADDVAFTISRVPNVPNSPGGFGGYVRAITKVDVVDPLTLHLHTAEPHPLLPGELAAVAVISRHAGEGATTEDYNSGKAAIGTGPYKYVSYQPGNRTELALNEAYWGKKPIWTKVNYRVISNDGSRSAALLAGDVDVIDQVPTADLAKLGQDTRVTLTRTPSLRLIYLAYDFSRQGSEPFITDNDGKPLPKNPFQDIRVRQALSHAVNREAITDRIMEKTAEPTGQWLPPGAFGYNPAVTVPKFDPALSKKLLTEAGFPQGFKLTLHTPNDRYPNDAKTAQAVAQFWTRIGVKTEVEALPWASFAPRSAKQEFSVRLIGWGSSTGEASYAMVNILGTYDTAKHTGATNSGRYSNPQLDALTAKASATLDDGAREKLLQEGVKMVADEAAILPLYMLTSIWGTKKALKIEGRMDERTLAMAVTEA